MCFPFLDSCGWSNRISKSRGRNILWLRIQPNSKFIGGRTLAYDHTTTGRNGHYLVMPLQMQAGSNAVLRSPLIKGVRRLCFQMYYYAQAANGSIRALTVQMDDLTRHKSRDFQVNATENLEWTFFQATFTNLPSIFALQIVAANIHGVTSDIGVDDLSITFKSCSSQVIPTSTTPLPIGEQKMDCNFDSGKCNWKYNLNVWKVGSFENRKLKVSENTNL